MSQQEGTSSEGRDRDDQPVPAMQEIFDNIWFLFLVSGVIILVSYIIWGLIDLVNRPNLP